MDLAWKAGPADVAGYNIYRATASGGSYSKINYSLLTGLSYSDTGVESGVRYCYIVKTVSPASVETAYSHPACLTVAGVPASISVYSGSGQSTAINTPFGSPLIALVVDSGGNPVASATVTFTAPASGASGVFANKSGAAKTNAQGIAMAPALTANGTVGSYTVTAKVPGVASEADFLLTNTPAVPGSITAAAGSTPQVATVGTAFGSPLTAVVRDGNGKPVSGVPVTFTAPGGNSSGSFANNLDTAITDSSGMASVRFTARSGAGSYVVAATVAGLGNSAVFHLTNLPGPAAMVTAAGGGNQSVRVGARFSTNLQATVVDSFNNRLSNVPVTFTAPSSGASGSFPAGLVTQATTDANGTAAASAFTANLRAGMYIVTATAPGVPVPASFPLTNIAAPAAMITAAAALSTSALVKTPFSAPLAATVTDANGNPVSGASVTFRAPGGSTASGTFLNGTNTIQVTTNAQGVASSGAFTANALVGSYTVTATTPGVSTPAQFPLANTVGAPGSTTLVAGSTAQSTPVNTAFSTPLAMAVRDGYGNPVSGVRVTFTAPTAGATGSFANNANTATTDATGTATAPPFTANSVAGSYVVTASAAGMGNAASFQLTNLAGPVAAVIVVAGANQSAPIASPFSTLLQATAVDANNNPVPGAAVTFTAPGTGASGSFTNGSLTYQGTTNSTGSITAPAFTANTFAGSYVVTASAAGVGTVARFPLTNTAGAAGAILAAAGTPQNAPVNTAYGTAFQVQVVDADKNPVPNASVTFTAPASNASGNFAGSLTYATSTNASGVATAPVFTANTTAGTYAVIATTAALSAGFNLTNLPGAAASIAPTAGAAQTAQVGTQFATNLQGAVTDSFHNPVPNVQVTFTAPASGPGGTFPGNATAFVGYTNASGVATAPALTANTAAGNYNVTASAAGVPAAAQFNLANTAGAAGTVTAAGGASQSTPVLTAFGQVLQAIVTDSNGNPVSGATVTFSAPASGPSGSFAAGLTMQVVTDATGRATAAPFTANATAGTYAVTATAPGVSSPVSFSMTNTAGPAATILAAAGTPQIATMTTPFATQLQAQVVDANNNPVGNVQVTFVAPASGASGAFANGINTATTNAQGIATAPVFTANATVGSYTVTASVSGIATPASFLLTNRDPVITATGGTPQTTAVNTAFAAPLVATVTDLQGQPVSGAPVTFTVPAGGTAGGAFANGTNTIQAVTNAQGVASSGAFTANTLAGSYTVTATTPGSSAPASFSLSNKAGTAASITPAAGSTPQSATVSTVFSTSLAAVVKDAYGNPASGAVVTFAAPGSGASGSFANGTTATTDATGTATAPQFTANPVAGRYVVTASVTGVSTVASFQLTNVALPPPPVVQVAQAGATPTQIVIRYIPPSSAACTLEVSTNSNFSPYVPDVDPALFSGAGLDNRPGSGLSDGTYRYVVIGKRTADLALNGRRYSRALAPSTTYYERTTCLNGSSAGTATITTANLPYGSTYADVTVSDLSSPGTYPWPTIDSQTGSTTDVQTGVQMIPFGFGESWPSGPQTVMCGHALMNDGSGKLGYPCRLAPDYTGTGDIYWIDTGDGIVRQIGNPGINWGTTVGGDRIGSNTSAFSAGTPFSSLANAYYMVGCPNPCSTPPKYDLLKGAYTGSWQTGDMGSWRTGITNVTWTNLAPASAGKDLHSLLHAFDNRFDPAQFVTGEPALIGLTGDESKIVLQFSQSFQNTFSWLTVFDPVTQNFVAAAPTWQSPLTRWCGEHSQASVDGSGSWLMFTPADGSWSGGWWNDGNGAGDGPFLTTISAPLTATPQYPAGADLTTAGFPGVICGRGGCDVRTVAGQPCDPTPSGFETANANCTWHAGWYQHMNVAVGDVLQVQDSSHPSVLDEPMQIIGINGNSWVLQRGWWPNSGVQDHGSNLTIGMVCAVPFQGGNTTYGADTVGWNFVADPHGSGSGMIVDSVADSSHNASSSIEVAGQTNWASCLAGEQDTCVVIKTGGDPSAYWNQSATASPALYPPFAGNGAPAFSNSIESYTAAAAVAPTVSNAKFVMQTDPVETGNFTTWTSLGGGIYQLTVNQGTVNPKTTPLLTDCMGSPMLDVSSAAPSIQGPVASLSAANTYCYAFHGGECYGGSTAGQIYANCPAYNGDQSKNYAIVGSQLVAKVSQLRWDTPAVDAVGGSARPLTSTFRQLQRYSSFLSARVTPDGRDAITYSDDCGGGTGCAFLMPLPPTTPNDAVDRTTFVPVNVAAAGGHGTALVKFGYVENGAANAFYCSSRREVCEANLTTPAPPYFSYASENPAGVPCNSGCTIPVPAISGRALYYQVVYGDSTSGPVLVTPVP